MPFVAHAYPQTKSDNSLSPVGTEINSAFQNRFSTDSMANGFTSIGSFNERIRQLQNSEDEKTQLIEDLFNKLLDVETRYRQSLLDHDREKRYNRDGQLREREYQTRLSQLQGLMDISPFVLVLMDGDGMLFEDQYVRCGEQGGKEAASQLDAFIREYVQSELPLHTSSKIMIQIYANVKGLAQAYYRSGVIDKPSIFEDFVRGFDGNRLLNDFIDVGLNKDRIDGKIVGHFTLFIDNSHCHQIFLGIGHEDSYTQLLEKVQNDPSKCSNITLVEGLPFEPDIAAAIDNDVFHSLQFPGLFRTTKLPVNSSWAAHQLHTVGPTLPPTSPLARISSNTSTSTTGSAVTTPHRMSFASVAANQSYASDQSSASPKLTPSPTFSLLSPAPSSTIIKRNRKGQRIDEIDKSIPNHDVQRIKKLKLCNVFYLLGACHNSDCQHDHSKNLNSYEKRVLGIVARMTPCHSRTECENPRCIYGHRCPQNEAGRQDCYYRENCHFWGWGHGIDETVVRTTKV